jgi:protein TonB
MDQRNGIMAVEAGAGNFAACLVEGSAEDNKRGRKIKRRAIALSIALESAGLTALVIAPMLAKPAEPGILTTTPIPPYSAPRSTPRHSTEPIPQTVQRPCVVCRTAPIAPSTGSFAKKEITNDDGWDRPDIEGALPDGRYALIKALDPRAGPPRPLEPPQVKRIHETSIDPALLIRRVEPVFPPILRQLHRSGRVELRAVIATDGTVQSLQVLSGDALCVGSALDAVRQWRYKPTLLNGQPVEVDTFITVIYTVNQP